MRPESGPSPEPAPAPGLEPRLGIGFTDGDGDGVGQDSKAASGDGEGAAEGEGCPESESAADGHALGAPEAEGARLPATGRLPMVLVTALGSGMPMSAWALKHANRSGSAIPAVTAAARRRVRELARRGSLFTILLNDR